MLRNSGISYAKSCVIVRAAPIIENTDREYQPPRKNVNVGIVSRYSTTITSPSKAKQGLVTPHRDVDERRDHGRQGDDRGQN